MWLLREKSERKKKCMGIVTASKALYFNSANLTSWWIDRIFLPTGHFFLNNRLITWTINGTQNRSSMKTASVEQWEYDLLHITRIRKVIYQPSSSEFDVCFLKLDKMIQKLIENTYVSRHRCWYEIWCHFKIFFSLMDSIEELLLFRLK